MSEREEKLKTLLKNIKESDPPSLMALIMAFSQEWQEIMNMSKEKLSEEEDKIAQEILLEYDQKHFNFIEAWEKGKFQPNQQEMSMLEKIYLNIEPIFKQADEYENGPEFKNLSEDDKKKSRKALEKIKKYKPILEKLLKKNGLLSSSSETPSSNEMIIDTHGDSDGNKANDGKQLSSPKPSPPNPKKPPNTLLIVAIFLLVVVILAIGLIVFIPYFKSSKDKKSKKINGKGNLSKTSDISEKDETITITEAEKKDKRIPTPKKKKEKTKN